MISTFFLSLGTSILTLIIGYLPVSTGLPTDLTTTLVSLAGYINSFSFLFPVNTLFTVVVFVLTFETIWWGFFGLLWLWKRLPFIGK